MVRKTREDALETRNQLLDAAERTFLEKGFSHASLNDVAVAAGLTRGAVYWHFKNKADLFEALIERVRLPVEALGDCGATEEDADPLGRLHEFAVRALTETVVNQRRRRVFTILFHKFEFNEEAQGLEIRHQAAFMDCMHRVEHSLQKAANRGQLPRQLDARKGAVAFQAFFTGLMANWLFMPRSFDLKAIAVPMVDGFFVMLKQSDAMLIEAGTGTAEGATPQQSE